MAPNKTVTRKWWEAMAAKVKRLYRSKKDKMLGGVCGGIAEYYSLDPTIVRVLAVVIALLPGPAILAYLVMWGVIPVDPGK